MMNDQIFNYTYNEVRAMIDWEFSQQHKNNPAINAQTANLVRAFTDEMIKMWESAGLTARIDLQKRVEEYRKAK